MGLLFNWRLLFLLCDSTFGCTFHWCASFFAFRCWGSIHRCTFLFLLRWSFFLYLLWCRGLLYPRVRCSFFIISLCIFLCGTSHFQRCWIEFLSTTRSRSLFLRCLSYHLILVTFYFLGISGSFRGRICLRLWDRCCSCTLCSCSYTFSGLSLFGFLRFLCHDVCLLKVGWLDIV